MRAPRKDPWIDTVHRQDHLGSRPCAQKRLVIKNSEVVPEPHDGYPGAASPQARRRVPLEGIVCHCAGLVGAEGRHRHRRTAHQTGRRARWGGAHGEEATIGGWASEEEESRTERGRGDVVEHFLIGLAVESFEK